MDVFCVMSKPMLRKYSWFQKTVSLGKNQAFHGLCRTVLDVSSWISRSSSAAVPCSPYRWCSVAVGPAGPRAVTPSSTPPALRWHRQRENRRLLSKPHLWKCTKEKSREIIKEDAGTWDTQARESGKKTGPGGANRLEAVTGQGQKTRKDLKDRG